MSESVMKDAPSQLRRLAEVHSEPDWLTTRRESAWAVYDDMPTPRLEKTDISKRSWTVGAYDGARREELGIVLSLVQSSQDKPFIYIQDGAVKQVHLPEALSAEGVIFCSLHDAATNHPALFQKYFGTAVKDTEGKWETFNAALWEGGAFLFVPKHLVVDGSFLFIDSHLDANASSFPRLLVVGAEGSQFSLTEVVIEAADSTTQTAHSLVAEVVAEPTANVTYAFVNRFRKGGTHYVTRKSVVGQDSQVTFVGSDVGEAFTVSVLESYLKGNGSRANIQMVGLGYGRQRIDLTASMVHGGRYSESDIKLYGVLRDRANSLYRSSTQILDGAVAAGSEQSDRMLMVDTTARADAIPMLLIDENDVQRCGHAASVGKLDPNHIYYLMSRGISERDARRMIVWGYLEPTLDNLPIPEVRTMATNMIDEVLG